MKVKWNKSSKIFVITLSIILIFAGIVIACISPITKYLVQKYDEKYTGRKITMDWAYVNPFTGYIHFSNLKIYEYKSDTLFISMNGLSANFETLKLFSKTIEIKGFTLNKPRIIITKTNVHFNFDDLITKFSSSEAPDTTKEPFHLSLINVKIKDGHFYYVDNIIPVHFSIKNVDIESKDGWRWNNDSIAAKFSFLSEIGTGGMKGIYGMNLKSLKYNLDVVVKKFDLKVIEQYLKDITSYGTFSANLDADLKTKGSLKEAQDITIKGLLAISDFHFGKNPKEDYLSFDKVVFNMKEVNPKNQKYFIDSMSLIHPFFKYELYDNSNNLETMFGKNAANVKGAGTGKAQFNLILAIGKYVEQLAKNFLHSNYKVNKVGIYKCNLQYNDYSLAEKFSIALNPLEIRADSVYKTNARVNLMFKSGIKPYGNASIRISINPVDSSDFDIYYNVQKVPLPMFNPFLISLTSFPLDRGTLEFNGAWNVRNGNINSTNHILLIDPRLTNRVRKKGIKWIPMRIVMAFVREQGNVVDYEIPISGNLNKPTFHWRDVIFDIVKNIFVKPVTTPYRITVKNVETEIEKFLTLKWDMRSKELEPKQQNFVERMALFLSKNPEASITVNPQHYTLKEKEYILLYETRKKYYMVNHNKNANSFSEEDAEKVDKMSIKDTMFVRYLNKHINDPLVFTIQDKCSRVTDPAIINNKFNKLNKDRAAVFMAYFKERNVEKQVHFSVGKSLIPYNGFSFYKIDYKGEFPESLLQAYRQMNELDNEAPRKKFKKERNKTPLK